MPRNSDFEYEGLNVSHAEGWSANDYHNRKGLHNKPRGSQNSPGDTSKARIQPQAMGKLNNVVRPQVKAPEGKQTNIYDHQLEQAKAQDWRNRNLTNNTIIDN
jgi:hypothetical protein